MGVHGHVVALSPTLAVIAAVKAKKGKAKDLCACVERQIGFCVCIT